MGNKSVYVVTQTIVGLVAQSVDTFVLGYSEERNDAKSILKKEYERLCKLGYDIEIFDLDRWKLYCKYKTIITKTEIHVAVIIDVR
ncbi:MAG: hypothetical protein MR924_11100 [Prevotella sp.]|nr:hypothetical protein [Prevotella sp.]